MRAIVRCAREGERGGGQKRVGFRGGGVLWSVFFVVYNNFAKCMEPKARLIQRGLPRYTHKERKTKRTNRVSVL